MRAKIIQLESRRRNTIPNLPNWATTVDVGINFMLASCVGLRESVIILRLHQLSSIIGTDIDGIVWVRLSYRHWVDELCYLWSSSSIARSLLKLVEQRIIITGNFNENIEDSTLWYRINYNHQILQDL